MVARALVVLPLLFALGCVGQLLETGGERGGPSGRPRLDGDAAVPLRDGAPDPTTPEPAALYPHASVGARCAGGALVEHLVLSTRPPGCEAHAAALAGPDPREALVVPLGSASPARATVTICDAAGCEETEIEVTFVLDAAGARGEWSATLHGQLHREPFDALRCDYEASAPSTSEVPAADLAVREVALYQGVEAVVARDGEALAPGVPIVAGRDALLRVFVEPAEGFVAREIALRVHLGEGEPLEARARVSAASRRDVLESSLNVRVPGERLDLGATLRVELLEVEPGCAASEAPPGSTYPPPDAELDAAALPVDTSGGPLRIVIVPVRYEADGSGRLPSLDAALLESFRAFAYALFPVRAIELVVRDAPMSFGGTVSRDGSGWSALLNACRNLRVEDSPPDDTYYYCAFAPAPSFREFCGRGCTAGLGFVPSARDVASRTSIGLGYPGAEDTFAHEVGHTLGRPHSPCGSAGDPDPGYPHAGGVIGAWGYDLGGNQLLAPDAFGDLMGYCSPKWISDYTYARIFARVQAIRALPFVAMPEPVRHASVVVDVDGSLAWGGEVTLTTPPMGEPIAARWITASGSAVPATAIYSRASDLPGGALWVSLADEGVRLELDGLGALAVTP